MPRSSALDRGVLEAALVGLQTRLEDINQKIADVRRLLGGRSGARDIARTEAPAEAPARKPRRKMSAAARKRISEAQRRRWAQFRAQGGKARRGGKAAPAESE